MNVFDLNTYNYVLPPGLVANKSVPKRDESKLMVAEPANDYFNVDLCFKDILNIVDENYVIVRNNTKVFPARLIVLKMGAGTMLEMLFLRHIDGRNWEVLCKRAKKARLGDVFCYSHIGKTYNFKIKDRLSEGVRVVDVGMDKENFLEFLGQAGLIPLPPYIDKDLDFDYKQNYQTIYAKHFGSVAAPTAGFHFSEELDQKLQAKGVILEEVTLHVGLGTFMPVREDDIRSHKMHEEWMNVDTEVIERLNKYKKQGKKILAVGTTTTRFLESLVDDNGYLNSYGQNMLATDLFVYPGYKFRFVDELITNFHLPKSTLLMLVSAFIYQKGNFPKELDGVSWMKKVYNQAILNRFRFYSFGDAMYIK